MQQNDFVSPREDETTTAKLLKAGASDFTSPGLKICENIDKGCAKTVAKRARGLNSFDRSQGKINSLRNRNYNPTGSGIHPDHFRKSQKDVSLRLCANGNIELT